MPKRGRLSLKLRQHTQDVLPWSGKQCTIPISQPGDEGQIFSSTSDQPSSGLNNLGNTCYCNAVLQALRHCPGFNMELKRAAHDLVLPFSETHVIHRLSQLIQEMESSVGTVTPTTFLDMLRNNSDQFPSKAQHDAQELLNYLLSQIQIPHNRKRRASVEELPKKLLKTGKEESHHGSISVSSAYSTPSVTALFQGRLTFLTRCFDCDKCTRRTEPFLHVSVPVTCPGLPGFPPVPGSSGCSASSSAAPVSLSWCLSQFMSQERLAWTNKFWCDYCGHLVEAERRTHFSTLPKIFTVHLNRFSVQDWGKSVSKVAGSVAVPLSLNLMPWSSQDCAARNCVYYLQAVVLHSGASCHSGHYTAIVWVSGQWLHYDDETVQHLSDTTIQELLSPLPVSAASPYILFYCRY